MPGCKECIHFRGVTVKPEFIKRMNYVEVSQATKDERMKWNRKTICHLSGTAYYFEENKWRCSNWELLK